MARNIHYKSYFKNFKSKFEDWEKEGVTESAMYMQNKLKEKLSQHGSGRKYKRGNKIHVASRKGEPPAVDRGGLRRSIKRDIYKSPVGWAAKVGSDLIYGLALERGFIMKLKKGMRRVGKRPWLQPTFIENEGAVEQLMAEPFIKGSQS